MIDREHIVAAVLAASGGQLTGRVRLQKAVYLLEQLGLSSNFEFEYHHYGPFSRDLDNAVADARAFHLIEEQFERRQSDGATYSIFKLKDRDGPKSGVFGTLDTTRVEELARLFAETNVTVLELAATVDWLCRFERCHDWKSEITKRKGLKVQGKRLEKAVDLLKRLGLSPYALPSKA